MIASALLLGGAGALCWAGAGIFTAPSSRALGPTRAVLWLGLVGVPFGIVASLAVTGVPEIRTSELPALVGAGLFLLVATQVWSVLAGRGRVSLAAPIVACDGAVAALAAVLTGHALPFLAGAGLVLMVVGLLVLTGGGDAEHAPSAATVQRPLSRTTTLQLAVVAAAGYGGMLFCAGTVEGTAPLWTSTFARGLATVGALALCLRAGQLMPNRRGLPFAAAAGICDVTGFGLFVAGAQYDPAIAAVAASQYGAFTVLAAVAVLGERLTRRQVAAVAVLVVGAGVVAATG